MSKSKNNRPTFIKLGNMKDSEIKDNTAIGDIDFADIKNVEQSQIADNIHIKPDSQPKKHWHEKAWGKIVIGVVVGLILFAITFFINAYLTTSQIKSQSNIQEKNQDLKVMK